MGGGGGGGGWVGYIFLGWAFIYSYPGGGGVYWCHLI